MSKQEMVPSNRLNEARNQIKKYKGVKVPNEIPESEKDYFHVLMIDSKPNAITLEFEHKVKTQIFNLKSFTASENQYRKLGVGTMVVYHNPQVKNGKLPEDSVGNDRAIEETTTK